MKKNIKPKLMKRSIIKNNLQPWIDYIDGLQRLTRKGYLEMFPKENEAYITRAAFCVITNGYDVFLERAYDEKDMLKNIVAVKATARNINIYAAYLSQEGIDYLVEPFALHIVEERSPHNLLLTILISRFRLWWKPWVKRDKFKVICYTTKRNIIKKRNIKREILFRNFKEKYNE